MDGLRRNSLLSLLGLVFLLSGCAKRGFPPGGPADTVSPQITSSNPPDKSNSVALNSGIEISFSEKMNRPSVEKSLSISPETPVKLKWKKNSLILEPEQQLGPNKTYVVTLGSDCLDLEGNRLTDSYSFAFSTGRVLDSGTIAGYTIQDGKSESGVSVWAYSVSEKAEIDPLKSKPDYFTLSGTDGGFQLKYLALAGYRIFAVKDLNKNRLWDPPAEALGVPFKETVLESQHISVEGLRISLAVRDTSEFLLVNCHMPDSTKLKLTFNKELHSTGKIDLINFSLIDQDGRMVKPVSFYSPVNQFKDLFLEVSALAPAAKYLLRIGKLSAADGSILTDDSCNFLAVSLPDKTPPEIVSHTPGRNELHVPAETEIVLHFSEPMQSQIPEKDSALTDSGAQAVPGDFAWIDRLTLSFTPHKPLLSASNYAFALKGSAVSDLAGNTLKDTLFLLSFRTLNSDSTGAVTGEISLEKEKYLGNLILNLKGLDNSNKYQQTLSNSQAFEFRTVLPGKYSLEGFVDFDGNGLYSPGSAKPFFPAEPFSVSPDTIFIRSRWTTEKVSLRF